MIKSKVKVSLFICSYYVLIMRQINKLTIHVNIDYVHCVFWQPTKWAVRLDTVVIYIKQIIELKKIP